MFYGGIVEVSAGAAVFDDTARMGFLQVSQKSYTYPGLSVWDRYRRGSSAVRGWTFTGNANAIRRAYSCINRQSTHR